MITATEIVQRDIERNLKKSPITIEDARSILESQIRLGSIITRHGDTLFISKQLPEGGIEFHTMNADTADNLVANTKQYIDELRRVGAQWITTTYDNPKITTLIGKLSEIDNNMKYTVKKIDGGLYKTYKATIELEK